MVIYKEENDVYWIPFSSMVNDAGKSIYDWNKKHLVLSKTDPETAAFPLTKIVSPTEEASKTFISSRHEKHNFYR